MSLAKIVARSKKPITHEDLAAGFADLGIQSGQTVLCHSSMSAFGWICGGAQTFVLALEKVLGTESRRGGTLVMPAQSGDFSAPMLWSDPPVPEAWWQTVVDSMPAFDPDWSPSTRIGQVAETFRTQPGTLRSNHPQVSFSARGPRARRVVSRHDLHFGLGNESPLAALYDAGGSVLLAGCGWSGCTALHLSEHRCEWPWKAAVTERAPIMVPVRGLAATASRISRKIARFAGIRDTGSKAGYERRWVSFSAWNLSSDDFDACGADFEKRYPELVKTATIGEARCLLVPIRELVDFGVSWFPEHRSGIGEV